MIEYTKLYKLDNKNKIRVWFMQQDNEKYRTVAGILNGSLVYSDWTISKSKNLGRANETTSVAQATLEVAAKYTKQLKTGYYEKIDDVYNELYVQPMLAKKFNDYKIDLAKGNYGVQLKLNGFRCIITKDSMKSRKGEDYLTCPHIAKSLSNFFVLYPDAILDGELFNFDLRQELNEISKLLRKTVNITPHVLSQSEKLISFYIYDGYNFDGLDQSVSYEKRKKWIDDNIHPYGYVIPVETTLVKNAKDLEIFYTKALKDGQEGVILRNLSGPYENKRSKNLLKLKPDDDAEFKIIDIKEGEGNWSGKAKIISLLTFDNKTFDASFKGTMEEAYDLLQEKDKWIGKTVTIKYNGLTGKGTPNYAQFDIKNQPHKE